LKNKQQQYIVANAYTHTPGNFEQRQEIKIVWLVGRPC